MVRNLLNIIREKLPEVYAAFVQRRAEATAADPREAETEVKGWER